MSSRSRLALMFLAAVVAVLVIAVPAQAASQVRSGSSQLTVSPAYATELLAKQVTAAPVAPVTVKTKWNKVGNMYWWFRVPMAAKHSVYTPSKGIGTFYHRGSLRLVEASALTHQIFRAEGIRVLALGKNSYQLSVSYKTTAGPYTRVTLAESTNKTKITHRGKAYKIDGVQFKLTKEGHDAILATIGESLDRTRVIFNTDLLPVLR